MPSTHLGPRPNFNLLTWGILSDERTDLSFTIAAGFDCTVILGSESRGTHFTVPDSRLPQPEEPGSVFISPRNRVSQIYPQALSSILIASYDLKGYGGSIWTGLEGRTFSNYRLVLVIYPRPGPHRKQRFKQLLYYCLLHSYYLAMPLSLTSQFLLWGNMPQY
jgi:hypothetical protein